MTDKQNDTNALATPVTIDTADAVFQKMVHGYVAKMAAMKIIQPTSTVDAAMDMGQWMLVNLAQNLWGVPQEMAFQLTALAIKTARHNLRQAM
jgi:hypothetical protein